jgi:hypothetical protein
LDLFKIKPALYKRIAGYLQFSYLDFPRAITLDIQFKGVYIHLTVGFKKLIFYGKK